MWRERSGVDVRAADVKRHGSFGSKTMARSVWRLSSPRPGAAARFVVRERPRACGAAARLVVAPQLISLWRLSSVARGLIRTDILSTGNGRHGASMVQEGFRQNGRVSVKPIDRMSHVRGIKTTPGWRRISLACGSASRFVVRQRPQACGAASLSSVAPHLAFVGRDAYRHSVRWRA